MLLNMNVSSADRLAAVSDNTLFVLGAYFFAFFPWAVTSNIDFISEKWRTVRHTRELARFHLATSVLPMIYVAVYAEAQRRAEDSKELGAALAALFFNLFHVCRTVMGMIQLDAFVAWCMEAMDCVRAMKKGRGAGENTTDSGGVVNDDMNNSDGNESENGEDEKLEELLKVNNTVVDNELGGTDVTVKMSWERMWEGVKKRRWKPSEWLVTEHPEICTVRWSGALLCGLGKHWSGSRMDMEMLNKFFSFSRLQANLRKVTWDVGVDGKSTILSLHDIIYSTCIDLSESPSVAYGCSIPGYLYHYTFKSYGLEFESLRSSFPSDYENNNREKVALGLVDDVVVAKHLGVEKLAMVRQYFDRTRIPTNRMWSNAFSRLREVCGSYEETGDILSDHRFRYVGDIPLFPHRLQMVALWDECPNRRVLQASAHNDISFSLNTVDLIDVDSEASLFEIEPRPECIFEFCRSMAKNDEGDTQGVVLETVRTFLAEWLSSNAQVPDWEPVIPLKKIELPVSDSPLLILDKERLIWECQRGLQSELARTASAHPNLPTSGALIMLFILGLPVLTVAKVNEVDGESDNVGSGSEMRDSFSSNQLSIVRLPDSVWHVWRVSSRLAPQNISILIRVFEESSKLSVTLTLEGDGQGTRFIWQDWVDAAMGFMKGLGERVAEEGRRKKKALERTVRRAYLEAPMVKLCPLRKPIDYLIAETRSVSDDSGRETGTVRVWMGWPAFDVEICKFEMDEWLAACGVDLNNIAVGEDEYDRLSREAHTANIEVFRAEKVIRSIVSDIEDDI